MRGQVNIDRRNPPASIATLLDLLNAALRQDLSATMALRYGAAEPNPFAGRSLFLGRPGVATRACGGHLHCCIADGAG